MTCACGVAVTETPDGAPVAGGFGNAPPQEQGVLATALGKAKGTTDARKRVGCQGNHRKGAQTLARPAPACLCGRNERGQE